MLIGSRRIGAGSFAVAMTALALVGCGGGGGHGYSGNASGVFSMSIYDIEDVNERTPLTCDEVGGSTFSITLTDASGYQYAGAGSATCASGYSYFEATTLSVPAGYYTVDFYLYGDPQIYHSSPVIGSSEATNLYFGPGLNEFRDSVTPDPLWTQSFVFSWTTATACLVGEEVEFEFAQPGTNNWIISDFDCTRYTSGFSYPIPVTYSSAQWNLYFLNTARQAMDTITSPAVDVSVARSQGRDVSLGRQDFLAHH